MSGGVGLPAVLPAVIVGTDRRLVRRLRAAGARSADSATPLSSANPLVRARLRRLVGVGAVGAADGGRFYLDEAGWSEYRRTRRRRALIGVTLALVVLATAYLLLGG